jgi:hypothetical protein
MENLLILLWQLTEAPIDPLTFKFHESMNFARDKNVFLQLCYFVAWTKIFGYAQKLINLYINFHAIEPFKCCVKSNLLFPIHRIILRGYLTTISTE